MTQAQTAAEQTPPTDDFAAMLDESFRASDRIEGSVMTGTVIAIDNEDAVVDVGLKAEGRVPAQGVLDARSSGRGRGRRSGRGLCRALRDAQRRDPAQPRQGAPRGELEQARAGVQRHRQGPGLDLRPGQGRLRGRSRRRRGLPAGQPGRHPAGARRHAAAQQGRAVPDPQDGPAPRQHRGVAPGGPRGVAGRAAQRAARDPEGGPGPQGRGQEHHRLRRVRRSRRPRRPAARHRHLLAPGQPPDRGAARRRDGRRPGDPLQSRDPAHLARHEAARGRSLGGRRAEIPGRHQVQGPGHQHHRLRRLRRARARRRGPGPRLRDELDQEERPSGQDRLDQPGGRGDGARGRSGEAPHLARPQAVPGQSLGGVPGEPSGRRDGRGRDQEHHRVRPVHRSRQRDRRHGASLRPRLAAARRKRPSPGTRRAMSSRRWCSTSTSRRSASRSASSS